ncbi:unnamed protein product [Rotaria sp. Silwood1]|nr:unnamed protein product [Rotaria sp. Silwood1]
MLSNLYFTSTERSLLTHELLSRAHFDYEVDDQGDNQQNALTIRPITDPTATLHKVSNRPGKNKYDYSNII